MLPTASFQVIFPNIQQESVAAPLRTPQSPPPLLLLCWLQPPLPSLAWNIPSGFRLRAPRLLRSTWHGPPQVAAWTPSSLAWIASVSPDHFVTDTSEQPCLLKKHPHLHTLSALPSSPCFPSLRSAHHSDVTWIYALLYVGSVCPLLEHQPRRSPPHPQHLDEHLEHSGCSITIRRINAGESIWNCDV